MRKKIFLFFIVLAVGMAGKEVLIKVLKAKVQDKPDFLSSTLLQVNQGEKVTVVEEKANWILIKTHSGVTGYIHQSAIETSQSVLTSIIPGQKGASEREVALAAKGFSEENEKKIRGSKGFNFADLDWIMAQTTPVSDLKKFSKEGNLK